MRARTLCRAALIDIVGHDPPRHPWIFVDQFVQPVKATWTVIDYSLNESEGQHLVMQHIRNNRTKVKENTV